MLRSLFRVGLTLVVLAASLATIGSVNAADQDGSFHSAWTVFDNGGNWGTYYYIDKSTSPGGECWNHGNSVDITLTGQIIYPNSDYIYQPVSVQWQIYKVLSSTSVSLVKSSTVSVGTAYYDNPAVSAAHTFYNLPIGPTYIGVARLNWYDGYSNLVGYSHAQYDFYSVYVNGGYYGVQNACYSPYHPTASLSPRTGTVNSMVTFSAGSFPANTSLTVKWDGKALGSIPTNGSGNTAGSFKVPAAPMGTHKVRFEVGGLAAQRTFTVIPRIKITPSVNVRRGQTVNVSLRGYAAHETVNIRWKKGSTWVHIVYVTTSSTGSANIDVKVPAFVPNGATSVRGDGSRGRAQTNAVTVSGGTYRASEATKTPTPSSTASPTATATATAEPTQTPAASPSVEPTSPVSTPEASPTETPTETPAADTPTTAPTEIATPTVEATATPEATFTPIDDQATTEASQ